MDNEATTSSTPKKKVPRPTSEELEEAGEGLHSLIDAVKKEIKNRIPDNNDTGILAAKFTRLNSKSDAVVFIRYSNKTGLQFILVITFLQNILIYLISMTFRVASTQ
ncbi:hypothetical protein BDA99DRAFT_563728 [Phascolomyces articulosus]|uniref:Uncharacterized protein n=1 Tax=Phascolomyces articulosus TaxID=60185 RepID=A0AAD5K238_9FUNG|nr:hypothetical protein BDA99DRAFT_563728 [Phascolomyces articulosus]